MESSDDPVPAPPPEPLRLHDEAGTPPLFAGPAPEPVLLDRPGAGPADLLVTSGGEVSERSARLHRRIEGGAESAPIYDAGTPLPALDGLRWPCPLPNGRDSRFDLVAVALEGLVLLRNTGAADEPRFDPPREPLGMPADLGLGPGRIAQMTAEDWDGDGRIDLLVGYEVLGGDWPADLAALPPSQRFGFNQEGGHPGYDRHGRWRGPEPEGKLFWLRNSGEPGAPRFDPPEEIATAAGRVPVPVGTQPAPLVIGWGGGRAVELLLADSVGTVRLHRNFGGLRPPVLQEPRPVRTADGPLTLPPDRTSLVAGDLDGDGRPELLYGTADGRLFAVHAGRARDEALPLGPLLGSDRTLRFGAGAVVAVADLDRDGDLDLIAGDAAGRLWLAEDRGEPGRPAYAAPVELEAGGLPYQIDPGPDGRPLGPLSPPLGYACPAVADWDGNGRPDLIVGGAGGEVVFLHHNGGPTQPRFERPTRLRCRGGPLILPPRVRPAVADWRGTGELDLIGLDLQGFLALYARNGPYEVAPPRPLLDPLGRTIRLDGAFGQAGRCALWAGPWTGGDGLDVLVGLPRSNRHAVAAAAGLPLHRADDLPTVLLLERGPRDALVPRPLYHRDGRPVAIGVGGCSPAGVAAPGGGALDLLVGSDDGTARILRRDDLRW